MLGQWCLHVQAAQGQPLPLLLPSLLLNAQHCCVQPNAAAGQAPLPVHTAILAICQQPTLCPAQHPVHVLAQLVALASEWLQEEHVQEVRLAATAAAAAAAASPCSPARHSKARHALLQGATVRVHPSPQRASEGSAAAAADGVQGHPAIPAQQVPAQQARVGGGHQANVALGNAAACGCCAASCSCLGGGLEQGSQGAAGPQRPCQQQHATDARVQAVHQAQAASGVQVGQGLLNAVSLLAPRLAGHASWLAQRQYAGAAVQLGQGSHPGWGVAVQHWAAGRHWLHEMGSRGPAHQAAARGQGGGSLAKGGGAASARVHQSEVLFTQPPVQQALREPRGARDCEAGL